jgi:uncharacterized protein
MSQTPNQHTHHSIDYLWLIPLVWLALLMPVSAEPPKLLPLPDVRQGTAYSCGASALQAVLAYWGVEIREDKLMELLGTDPEVGTPPQAILRTAQDMGLKATLQEHLTLDDLAQHLEAGLPVIVAGQAWREDVSGTWADEWECGHYMVVIGLDHENVYFEDPSLLGSRGFIPREQFLERWHDVDGLGRKYLRLGILVQGESVSPPPILAPVE